LKKRTPDYITATKITAIYCTRSIVCSIGNETGTTVWHIHLFRSINDEKRLSNRRPERNFRGGLSTYLGQNLCDHGGGRSAG